MNNPEVLVAVLQGFFLIALSPLINGVIRRTKARLQRRRGPPVLQNYFDIFKLVRKEVVVSNLSSWITQTAPFIIFASSLLTAFLVPVITLRTSLGPAGDLLVLVYLGALGRFFGALAGLDAASAFGGMSSSRDISLAALLEAPTIMTLLVAARMGGSTHAEVIATSAGLVSLTPPTILLAVAFFLICLAETGRVPVDNPDTHLELTMIHEGKTLEFSGRNLALVQAAHWVRQAVLLTLLADLFLPWGIAASANPKELLFSMFLYMTKLFLLCLMIGAAESAFAKFRLFRVPELISLAFSLSVLALVVFELGQ